MIAVAQARMLLEAGWQVHIADAAGRQFRPSEFGELVMGDRELQAPLKPRKCYLPPPDFLLQVLLPQGVRATQPGSRDVQAYLPGTESAFFAKQEAKKG